MSAATEEEEKPKLWLDSDVFYNLLPEAEEQARTALGILGDIYELHITDAVMHELRQIAAHRGDGFLNSATKFRLLEELQLEPSETPTGRNFKSGERHIGERSIRDVFEAQNLLGTNHFIASDDHSFVTFDYARYAPFVLNTVDIANYLLATRMDYTPEIYRTLRDQMLRRPAAQNELVSGRWYTDAEIDEIRIGNEVEQNYARRHQTVFINALAAIGALIEGRPTRSKKRTATSASHGHGRDMVTAEIEGGAGDLPSFPNAIAHLMQPGQREPAYVRAPTGQAGKAEKIRLTRGPKIARGQDIDTPGMEGR